jgi:hypothetical protein
MTTTNPYAEFTVPDSRTRYVRYRSPSSPSWEVLQMRLTADDARGAHWAAEAVVLGGIFLTESKARAVCMILNAPEEVDD